MPERIHISSLIFGYGDDMNPVIERLKHESFDAVAASMPDNYSKDVGWFQRAQLRDSQYENAAELPAGQYAVFDSETGGLRNITRVDEVRPAASCNDALRAYPGDTWALNARATYEARSSKLASSLDDYTRQIAHAPDAPGGYFGRASIYYSQHRYRQALSEADRAVEHGANPLLRANIESAMGDDDLAEADAARGYEELQGGMVDVSPAVLAHATAYADLGYYKPAIDDYNKVLAKHPGDGWTLELRGYAYFSAGEDAQAKADLLRTVSENPKYEAALLDLALVYYAEHDVAATREYAARAHVAAPKEPYAALWLAIAQGHPRAYTPPNDPELEPELNAGMRSCETAFYQGIVYYEHHQPAQALPLLRAAADTCPYREHERAVAAHLIR